MAGLPGRLATALALLAAMVFPVDPDPSPPAAPSPSPSPSPSPTPSTVRILALGDSITAAGKWQLELDRLLTQAGVPHVIETEAVPGSRCGYWPPRITSVLAAHQPDLVALFCGTNDDPGETAFGESATGWSFRTVAEAVHGYRPANPAKMLPALIGYSDPLVVPDWLSAYEPRTNDTLWLNMAPYMPQGWFAGVADFQRLPATATYLDAGGVHPLPRGYQAMGRIVYDAARAGMGWAPTAATEPVLCDMYGHRKAYPRPAFTPCPWTGG